MQLLKSFVNSLKYILEAVTKNFAPNKEEYPATGVIPYTGEPYQEK